MSFKEELYREALEKIIKQEPILRTCTSCSGKGNILDMIDCRGCLGGSGVQVIPFDFTDALNIAKHTLARASEYDKEQERNS